MNKKTLDDLCVWKICKHSDKETKENTQTFELCKTCTGYEHRDCYFSHKDYDEYMIETK